MNDPAGCHPVALRLTRDRGEMRGRSLSIDTGQCVHILLWRAMLRHGLRKYDTADATERVPS